MAEPVNSSSMFLPYVSNKDSTLVETSDPVLNIPAELEENIEAVRTAMPA